MSSMDGFEATSADGKAEGSKTLKAFLGVSTFAYRCALQQPILDSGIVVVATFGKCRSGEALQGIDRGGSGDVISSRMVLRQARLRGVRRSGVPWSVHLCI
jgi:hypothetical protein